MLFVLVRLRQGKAKQIILKLSTVVSEPGKLVGAKEGKIKDLDMARKGEQFHLQLTRRNTRT